MDAGIKAIVQTLFDHCKETEFVHPHMIIVEELLSSREVIDLKIRDIKLAVYKIFGFTEETADSKTRKREIVQARQIAMYLSYNLGREFSYNWSLNEIGNKIGDKDHATVLHALKTVNNMIETNRRFAVMFNGIELEIRSKLNYNGNTEETTSSEST